MQYYPIFENRSVICIKYFSENQFIPYRGTIFYTGVNIQLKLLFYIEISEINCDHSK